MATQVLQQQTQKKNQQTDQHYKRVSFILFILKTKQFNVINKIKAANYLFCEKQSQSLYFRLREVLSLTDWTFSGLEFLLQIR